MKYKLMTIVITIILMLTSSITVFANTETTVTLQANKNKVKAGETFTVTLTAVCPDGINGIDTTYSYDNEKLELVSANVANSKFASLGIDNQITVISNSTESIQSADIYTITLKVKEGVEADSTATVSITETLLDSNATTNSAHKIAGQEVTITIEEETPPAGDEGGEETPPAGDEGGEETPPTGNGGGDEQPPTGNGGGDEQPPTGNGGGDEEPPTGNGGGDEQPPTGNGDGEEQPQSGNGGGEETPPAEKDEKDDTIADQKYDKAGVNTILIFIMALAIMLAITMYRKNTKYQDIK